MGFWVRSSGASQSSTTCTWNAVACPTCNCAFLPGLLNAAASVFGIHVPDAALCSPTFELNNAVELSPAVVTNITWMV